MQKASSKPQKDQAAPQVLDQKRQEYLAKMKERILKNKAAQEQNKDGTTAKGAAAAVLKPTLAPKEEEQLIEVKTGKAGKVEKVEQKASKKVQNAKDKAKGVKEKKVKEGATKTIKAGSDKATVK